MTDQHTTPIDTGALAMFALGAETITLDALNGMSAAKREDLDALLRKGAQVYLHVLVVPEIIILLMCDPAPGDPSQPPIEIARVGVAKASDAVKKAMH
jgi:hypothetical protein